MRDKVGNQSQHMVTASHVDQIVKDLLPYGPEKIILFGSAARGDGDEYSDAQEAHGYAVSIVRLVKTRCKL